VSKSSQSDHDHDDPSTGPGRTLSLTGGIEMPLLGLGVWQIPDGPQAEDAVRWALEAGYRHVDTAQAYGNEASVGRALHAAEVPREEVFVTTKFNPGSRDPVREAEGSLKRLGTERLDLYLIHWPQGGPTWAWEGMEAALERGLTRAIGVSNFNLDELAEVIDAGRVPPAVNQVDFSPFSFRRRLLAGCRERGVALEAYSPLTSGRDLKDPAVAEVARRAGRTPAQVMLRWAVQRGIPVIPKSIRRERIVENSRIFDFSIEEGEMERLDRLDRTGATGEALENRWWTPIGRARAVAARLARPLRG
jgi:diketogulonate reductase-like aldo/keto reductase